MAKYKKLLLYILIIITASLLSGCGSPKTVPDKSIEWSIEDFIKSKFDFLSELPKYTYKVNHSPDSSTKSDTVDVDLIITGKYFTAESKMNGTYVYDKSKDLWSLSRNGNWSEPTIINYSVPTNKQYWIDTISNSEFYYFSTGSVSKDYPGTIANKRLNIEDGVMSWNANPYLEFYAVQSNDSAISGTNYLFENWLNSDTSNFDRELIQSGSNYELYSLDGVVTTTDLSNKSVKKDQIGYLIRLDNNVIFFRNILFSNDPEAVEEDTWILNDTMRQLGFCIFD